MNPERKAIHTLSKAEIIDGLRRELLSLQGFRPVTKDSDVVGLGAVNEAFPNGVFPTGAVHEFMAASLEEAAASTGFISGILAALLRNQGVALWISMSSRVFPPAITLFGIAPEHIIFINPTKEKHLLWVLEEALKCEGLAAVVGDVATLSFMASRRLQLAVEKSRVTAFILIRSPHKQGTTASVTRWQISPLPSSLPDDMPGVGFPRWKVELSRVRNGKSGWWEMEWRDGGFKQIGIEPPQEHTQRKVG